MLTFTSCPTIAVVEDDHEHLRMNAAQSVPSPLSPALPLWCTHGKGGGEVDTDNGIRLTFRTAKSKYHISSQQFVLTGINAVLKGLSGAQ